jgi:ATP-dependent DNA helicase RecG
VGAAARAGVERQGAGALTREERPALPFELVREAVINALVHRDYDLTGATCHLVVTPDTVTVKSPGAPLAPVTLEQLQSFTAPMYNRNPKPLLPTC